MSATRTHMGTRRRDGSRGLPRAALVPDYGFSGEPTDATHCLLPSGIFTHVSV